MKFGVRLNKSVIGTVLLTASLMAASVSAQDYSSVGISDVVAAADVMLRRGDFSGAIPPLVEVVNRMKEMKTASGRETLQNSRFQLARCYFQTEKIAEGMDVLEVYLQEEPRKDERLAIRMMAQGYLDEQDWEKVEEYSKRLLAMGGLTDEDILNGNLLLGQAYFRQENWAPCVKPLMLVTKNTKDENIRKMSQIMTVQALMESGQWARLFGVVRNIYRSDAKYDITLNITLMNAGKALFEGAEAKGIDESRDDLLNSLFLYRMVLPREKLIAHSNKQIAEYQAELVKKSKIGIKEEDKARLLGEIEAINESVETLKALPPYEDEVTFRIGQIYAEVKRYWEAYVLFDSLYEKDRNGEIGEASVLQSVLVLFDMGESDRAEERVLRYLDEQPDGTYVRTILSVTMRHCLQNGAPDKVVSLRPYVDRLASTTEETEILLEGELHYMLAFGYLQTFDYKSSSEQFDVIVNDHPNSPAHEDAIYYRGLTYMFQADYQSALDDFKLYQDLGEHAEHFAASVFREGICLFGLDRIAEAEAVMTDFVETYPDSQLVSEAYSMRGDIEAAKDGRDNPDTPDIDEYDPETLDRALADYTKAIESYKMPAQAKYAVFQAARVYKLEFKWQEIIDLMNYYLNFLEGEADVAEAVFWIGQSQIEMNQVADAVTAYMDAIQRFGNEVDQLGVDKIVMGLVRIANQYLEDDAKQDLVSSINGKLNVLEEDQDVLKLRLRVAKAYTEDSEAAIALGVELLNEKQDLAKTTPISLALMCDAAVMSGDFDQMGSLYDYFMANFDEAEEAWHAFRAKTYQQMGKEDYAGALETIEEAQGTFGPESFMGWAQINKGKALFKAGEYKEAEDSYNAIMGVPEWRGSMYGEAMIGMAACRAAQGDYETAHSYYQRTYLLFAGYDDGKWAADGYLGAADCLAKLDRFDEAIKTLDEMLEDTYVNTLPQADTAREMKKKYGGA